jgi:peroxiredoxin
MKRFIAVLATVVFALSLAAVAFAADAPPPAAEQQGPKVGPNVGDKLASFKLTDPAANKEVSLENLVKTGNDTVLIFMQTACSLCVAEINEFVGAADELSGKVNVVLVSVDYDEKRIPNYAKAYSIPFPIAHDKEASVLESVKYGATPATVIVDGKGVIKEKYEGYDKAKVKGLIKAYSK